MLKKLKLLNLARKASNTGGKLMALIKEDQKAVSTSLLPQRKIRYQALVAALVAAGAAGARMYGIEVPEVIEENATEIITLLILTVGYLVAPKKGEVVND